MRQSTGIVRRVPCRREAVADKQPAVFFGLLPLRQVCGIAYGLANLTHDEYEVRLPRQPPCVGVPGVMPPVLCGIVHGVFGKVLNIARIIIYPRQGHGIGIIRGLPRLYRVWLARRPLAEVEFIYIDVVEGLREVLLAAAFKELAFYLGSVDFVDSDRAEFEKLAVPYFALENNLTGDNVRTVDVAENSRILRAVFQRKGYAQSIAVRTAEHSVFGHIFKRCAGFEDCIMAVDFDFHSSVFFTKVRATE